MIKCTIKTYFNYYWSYLFNYFIIITTTIVVTINLVRVSFPIDYTISSFIFPFLFIIEIYALSPLQLIHGLLLQLSLLTHVTINYEIFIIEY